MNCYILPKYACTPNLSPEFSFLNTTTPFISQTLEHYSERVRYQRKSFEAIYTKNYIDQLYKIFEPVVSLEKSHIFCYELLEIISVHLFNMSPMSTVVSFSKTPNITETMLKLGLSQTSISAQSSENFQTVMDKYINCTHGALIHTVDCFVFDISDSRDTCQNIHWLLLYLLIIIKYQMNGGSCVIKLNNIHSKQVVEIIYLFTTLYMNTMLVRPYVTPAFSTHYYLLCMQYTGATKSLYNDINALIYNHVFNRPPNTCISSLFGTSMQMPLYFLTKIDEVNIAFSHSYFSLFEQLITFISNSNNNNKHKILENIRKSCLDEYEGWRRTYNICEIFDHKIRENYPYQ